MQGKTFFATILILLLGLKMIGGGVVHASIQGMSETDCYERGCAITPFSSCLEHCFRAQTFDGHIFGGAQLPFLGLILFAGMAGLVFFEWRKSIQRTALAPPGLAFVRTTILRE